MSKWHLRAQCLAIFLISIVAVLWFALALLLIVDAPPDLAVTLLPLAALPGGALGSAAAVAYSKAERERFNRNLRRDD